jgi:hypothetical protein
MRDQFKAELQRLVRGERQGRPPRPYLLAEPYRQPDVTTGAVHVRMGYIVRSAIIATGALTGVGVSFDCFRALLKAAAAVLAVLLRYQTVLAKTIAFVVWALQRCLTGPAGSDKAALLILNGYVLGAHRRLLDLSSHSSEALALSI